MQKSRILITGGLGFIFSHVAEYFADKGHDVYILDNFSAGSHPELVNDLKATVYKLDCAADYAIGMIRKIAPDYIIHAAAISDVDESIQKPLKVLEKNNRATLNVFEAARSLPYLKKLLYVSTDEVYGECEHRKTEEEIIFPKNPYACSKAFGSLVRIAYDNTYESLKGKTVETRFCNVFGPRQDKRKILPAIKASLAGEYILPLHNEGTGFREYIYVKNIAPALELILEKGDRVYNVTLNDGYTVRELCAEAEKLTGKRVNTRRGNRPGMDMKYQMDNSRILSLGWKPLYTFEEGMREYLC